MTDHTLLIAIALLEQKKVGITKITFLIQCIKRKRLGVLACLYTEDDSTRMCTVRERDSTVQRREGNGDVKLSFRA